MKWVAPLIKMNRNRVPEATCSALCRQPLQTVKVPRNVNNRRCAPVKSHSIGALEALPRQQMLYVTKSPPLTTLHPLPTLRSLQPQDLARDDQPSPRLRALREMDMAIEAARREVTILRDLVRRTQSGAAGAPNPADVAEGSVPPAGPAARAARKARAGRARREADGAGPCPQRRGAVGPPYAFARSDIASSPE